MGLSEQFVCDKCGNKVPAESAIRWLTIKMVGVVINADWPFDNWSGLFCGPRCLHEWVYNRLLEEQDYLNKERKVNVKK
jgi:hypothetical protein